MDVHLLAGGVGGETATKLNLCPPFYLIFARRFRKIADRIRLAKKGWTPPIPTFHQRGSHGTNSLFDLQENRLSAIWIPLSSRFAQPRSVSP